MRTTLKLSTEAMAKVCLLARQHRKTFGAVVSELILQALEPRKARAVRNGVPLFAAGTPDTADAADEGVSPDLELDNRLRDQDR